MHPYSNHQIRFHRAEVTERREQGTPAKFVRNWSIIFSNRKNVINSSRSKRSSIIQEGVENSRMVEQQPANLDILLNAAISVMNSKRLDALNEELRQSEAVHVGFASLKTAMSNTETDT